MAVNRQSVSAYENFSVERVIIVRGENGIDISNLFLRMDIDEGIENGLIRGSVDFLDTANITDGLLPNGTEHLQVTFFSRSPSQEEHPQFVKLFRINRYEDASDNNTLNRKITRMHFVSVGEMLSNFRLISKSYNQVGSHKIVEDMLRVMEYDESMFNIETTLNNKDIVIPNLTPVQVISELTQCVQSGDSTFSGDSNFYFFESRDKINFVSGANLLSKDPVATLSYGPTGESTMYNKVVQYKRDRGYNLQDQAKNGGFGTNIRSHSMVDKSYRQYYMTFDDAKSIYKPLNASKWFGDVEDTKLASYEFRPEDQMYQFLNRSSTGNTAAIRRVNKTALQAKRAFATVPGDTNITAGVVVNLAVYNQQGEINLKDSGRWLVSRVTHILTQENYFMNLELLSDSNADGGL